MQYLDVPKFREDIKITLHVTASEVGQFWAYHLPR